jgi:signal transduction histidine kinase
VVTQVRFSPRAERGLAVVPFPLLAAATALEWGDPAPRVPRSVLLAVVAATAACLALVPTLHPRWPRRPAISVGYFVAALALMSTLVWFSHWFLFASWVVTVQTFVLFELRWAFFAAAAASVTMTALTYPGSSFPVTLAASLLAPLLMAGWRLGRESQVRSELVEELRETLAHNDRMRRELVERARESGMYAERQRVSREIHDTLAQEMAAMVSQLETVLNAPRGSDWRGRVTTCLGLARSGLAEARRSVRALGPLALRDASLPDALDGLVTEWRRRTGLDAEFDVDGCEREVPESVAAALFRVTQEALTNVDRHAGARRVRVLLSFIDATVSIDVRDDGVGFGPDTPRGYGLNGMRDRMSSVGGDLDVEAAPGAGTAIRAGVTLSEVPR